MAKTIDMQTMRNLNLFSKVSGQTAIHCLNYNTGLVFVVAKHDFARAMGEGGRNAKRLSEILNKRVKIVAAPDSIIDAERFVKAIVYPTEFKELTVDGDTVIINAGPNSKAMLIGRNRQRLEELEEIIKQYFGKQVRII